MEIINFYSHEKISNRLYIVTENLSVAYRQTIPVIVGAERILVVDSGLGVGGNLRKYIESFAGVTKPMFCIVTHGHPEQLGGAGLFDEAYLSVADTADFAEASLRTNTRMDTFARIANGCEESVAFCREVARDMSGTALKPVADGDVFHLGEARIEVYGLPGHTPGSMVVVYSHKDLDKYLLTSGALDRMTCLKSLDRDGLAKYLEALERLMDIVGDEIIICTGRTDQMSGIGLARGIAVACRDILAGRTGGDIPADIGPKGARLHFVDNVCVRYDGERLSRGEG